MEWSEALDAGRIHATLLPTRLVAARRVAGLVMTTMLVPVGIAYAEASGLPGINDLLQAAGIGLYFAEVKDPVKDKLKRFGLFAHFGEQTFLRHY